MQVRVPGPACLWQWKTRLGIQTHVMGLKMQGLPCSTSRARRSRCPSAVHTCVAFAMLLLQLQQSIVSSVPIRSITTIQADDATHGNVSTGSAIWGVGHSTDANGALLTGLSENSDRSSASSVSNSDRTLGRGSPHQAAVIEASVLYKANEDRLTVMHGLLPARDDVLVWGRYADTYALEGWYRLELSAARLSPFPDLHKARAAGYLEAYFTAPQIHDYWYNYRMNEYAAAGGAPSMELLRYVDRQAAFIRDNIRIHAGSKEYWRLMALVMAQFDGLVEGYADALGRRGAQASSPLGAVRQQLDWRELYLLQSVGDLYDLNVLYPSPPVPPPASLGLGQALGHPLRGAGATGRKDPGWKYTAGHGIVGPGGYDDLLECSALIKLAKPAPKLAATAAGGRASAAKINGRGRSSLFWAGHVTWRPYYAMVRTWKVYDFPWSNTGPLTIASSPGLLHSKDDWYTTDSLVVMETTNGIYNKSLFSDITDQCALMWQRVQVANFGAGSGPSWAALFAQHNSGTYNNGWMVLDVPRLEAGWESDVLWLLEQIPGRVEAADVSKVLLKQGYWAGYNVPYFESIYNQSGYPWPSILNTSPRARIFERDVPGVRSLGSMKRIMRYNRFQHDQLSEGLPNGAIAARYDLAAMSKAQTQWIRRPFGGIDGKIVDLKALRSRTTHVVCGPTADDQEPFSWSSTQGVFANVSHAGSVDRFDFKWQQYTVGLCAAVGTC